MNYCDTWAVNVPLCVRMCGGAQPYHSPSRDAGPLNAVRYRGGSGSAYSLHLLWYCIHSSAHFLSFDRISLIPIALPTIRSYKSHAHAKILSICLAPILRIAAGNYSPLTSRRDLGTPLRKVLSMLEREEFISFWMYKCVWISVSIILRVQRIRPCPL